MIQRLVKPVVRKINRQPTQMYEVKWEGYLDHTVEPRSTLLLGVPHLVWRSLGPGAAQVGQVNVQWDESDHDRTYAA